MYLLIINPFVSAQYLSESCKRLGINTIALYTRDLNNLDAYYKSAPDWFDKQIFLSEPDVALIVNAVKDYAIHYVLNGSDSTTALTDQVAAIITPQFANNPKSSEKRMDKYLMHKTLAENNLTCIRQYKFDVVRDDIHTLQNLELNYPCFVKPLKGAASKGAAKIIDYNHIQQFFAELQVEQMKSKLNLTMSDDLIYLIGEHIKGEEYLVDTFSYQGEHYVSSIQKYTIKLINNAPVICYNEIVTDIGLYEKISHYINHVLTALELSNGFAHSEIFIKSDGSPVLIEVNPRISGAQGLVNYIAELAGLPTQSEFLARYVFHKSIDQKARNKEHPCVRLLALFHFSQSAMPDFKQKLKNYKSVKLVKQLKPVGYIRHQPIYSGVDVAAFVVCYSEDFNRLSTETHQILHQDEMGW